MVGRCGRFVASLPSNSVGVRNPHDFDLHPVVGVAVSSEVILCFRSFQIGSDLLLDNGGGNGIVGVLVGLDKGVYCRLMAVYS